MKKTANTVTKILICTLVVYELIQTNSQKKQFEELGVLKKEVNDLQTALSQKQGEIESINSQKEAFGKQIEEEKELMKDEIKELKETASNLNEYMASTEQTLSTLSKDLISDTTHTVIRLIRDKDFQSLSKYVHPNKGLKISHTTDLKTSKENIIPYSQISSVYLDTKKYTWGIIDGEGKDIKLSFKEYYDMYIYDVDYANKAEITYNKYTQRTTQGINDVYERYSSGIVVEYFYKGTEENNYIDWKSLYLCYEQIDSKWYLSAVIHS